MVNIEANKMADNFFLFQIMMIFIKNQINLWRIFSVKIYQERIIRTYYFFLIKCIWSYIFVFIAGLKNWFGWSLLNLTKKLERNLHHARYIMHITCFVINVIKLIFFGRYTHVRIIFHGQKNYFLILMKAYFTWKSSLNMQILLDIVR